jgi:hypothetical protein
MKRRQSSRSGKGILSAVVQNIKGWFRQPIGPSGDSIQSSTQEVLMIVVSNPMTYYEAEPLELVLAA